MEGEGSGNREGEGSGNREGEGSGNREGEGSGNMKWKQGGGRVKEVETVKGEKVGRSLIFFRPTGCNAEG